MLCLFPRKKKNSDKTEEKARRERGLWCNGTKTLRKTPQPQPLTATASRLSNSNSNIQKLPHRAITGRQEA